jgi:hypothetical protein
LQAVRKGGGRGVKQMWWGRGGAVDDIPVWVYIVDLGAVPEVNWTEKYGSCFVANDLDG